MALNDETKRKMMEETIARLKSRFRSASSAPPRGGMLDEAKRQAMDVKAGLKTVSQIGWQQVAVGAAVYAAHIRQMDAQRHRARHTHPTVRGQKILDFALLTTAAARLVTALAKLAKAMRWR